MEAAQKQGNSTKRKGRKEEYTIDKSFTKLAKALGRDFTGYGQLSDEQKTKWMEDLLTSVEKALQEADAGTSKNKNISGISCSLLEIVAARLSEVDSIKALDRELRCLSQHYDEIKGALSKKFMEVKKNFTPDNVKLLLKCDTGAEEWQTGAQPRLLSKFYCDLCESMNDEIKGLYREWCEDKKLLCYLPAPQDEGDSLLNSLKQWMNARKEELKQLKADLKKQKNENARLSEERNRQTAENADLKDKKAKLESCIRQLTDEKAALEQENAELNRSLVYAQNEAKNAGNRALAGFKHDLARDIKAEIEDLSTPTARNDINIMIELTDTLLQKMKRQGIPPED